MLAPRKKLWSTPPEVIEQAIESLAITLDDVVYDIGAGDGRFVISCHQRTQARCVGIEIDDDRADEAIMNITNQGFDPKLCTIIKGNALEQDYHDGTVFFLYLIPRGLKLILPILQAIPRRLRVATYMSPFPETIPCQKVLKVGTQKLAEAQWPVYLYELNGHINNSSSNATTATAGVVTGTRSVVSIRPYTPNDAVPVMNIWVKGLDQTAETAPWILRPLLSMLMKSLASSATSDAGDFGPAGVNIAAHWMGDDRTMLVATLPVSAVPGGDDTTRGDTVVGCCCVKRGTSETQVAPAECTDYSVFRLSVADQARGHGVGKILMGGVEDWAKERGGKAMYLTTANSVAGLFYEKIGYNRVGWFGYTKPLS